MTILMANNTAHEPEGIAKDVRVQIGRLTFLADFVVMDAPDESVVLLGRPFLATSQAILNYQRNEVSFTDGTKKETFGVNHTMPIYEDLPWSENMSIKEEESEDGMLMFRGIFSKRKNVKHEEPSVEEEKFAPFTISYERGSYWRFWRNKENMKLWYKPGALVLVKKENPWKKNGDPEWLGPFMVTRLTNGGGVEIYNGSRKMIVGGRSLALYASTWDEE